jgi:ubiquinone/menaquinone biosynthesis C-methylase UbiE
MSGSRRSPYPDAVPDWMVGTEPARVLDLGTGSGAFAEMLHRRGHEVFGIDRHLDSIATLPERLGTRLHVVGQVESLPYLSCNFDVVTASQTLHRFAPGLALTEIARVLKPGGWFAIAYNTRDDTVPWVRRLISLVQQADPEAMKGDYGHDSVDAIVESPYFVDLQRRDFRNWMPITRAGLLAMVERRPSMAALDPDVRAGLLRDVGALYDSSARAPDPLMLPFKATCWRATVDHAGLVLGEDTDALEIHL